MKASTLALPLGALLVACSSMAIAEVYRCTDPATKKVTYSGTPCAAGTEHKVSITDNAIMDGAAIKRAAGQRPSDLDDDADVPPAARARVGVSAEEQARRAQLADECSRGFKRSCSTLRLLNTGQPVPPVQSAAASPEAQRLAQECERGFKKSCDAYRALSGEQERKKTVCRTVGVSDAYAQRIGRDAAIANGTYVGKSVCRERPDD